MTALNLADLRELAERLEAHGWDGESTYFNMMMYAHTPERFRAAVKALGGGEKGIDDDGIMYVRKTFAGGSSVKVELLGTVCERVQTGTKEVPVYERAQTGTREVPVYEYDCPPILGFGDGT